MIGSAAEAAQRGASPGHVEAFCSTGSSPGEATHGVVPARLHLEHRGPTDAVLHYETHGPEDAPAVVVLGGISAGRHLGPTPQDSNAGWWPGVVGRGGILDGGTHRLVGFDFLAGPEVPLAGSAPVTTADQAEALVRVLDHLGIPQATVVGASYGGMVALALSLRAPERVACQILLCAAHRSHPMATAVRALQRRFTLLAASSGRAEEGLALARALAMTTYRSAREFESRFPRSWTRGEEGRPRFAVESYLESRGRAFVDRFPHEAFLSLSESIDLHDVDPASLSVPTTLVSFDSDALVPPWLVQELADRAGCRCRHVTLSSLFGHDAFLKEAPAVSAVLLDALQAEVAS